MDRRIVLAIGLMLIVAILPSLLWSPQPRAGQPGSAADTIAATRPPDTVAEQPPPVRAPVEPTPVVALQADTARRQATEDSVVVESGLYRLVFSTAGAKLISATPKSYRSFAENDSGPAQLIPPDSRFLEYSLVFGNDTVPLGDWTFEPSETELWVAQAEARLEWVARRGPATVRLTHTFRPDQYVFDVEGQFSGVGVEAGLILVSLGPRLRLVEADSTWDFRNYAVVTKAGGAERTTFRSLDPGERTELAGPFEWVALKSRYFATVLLTIDEGEPRIGGAVVVGGQREGRNATRADAAVSLPAPGGRFTHSVYVGPQEYRRLARIGHDLENINPYGWVFRPIIRPFANFIVRILLWMHETLRIQYGWVLVLFGLLVRVVLWPLNQKAMRSSMAMQAIQPEIKGVQERHKQDPQRLQQEMMKLYKEHGVNPLGGCVPMLIPMPVLFALFFVFRETIEFRGVPFLWLPDLSRADPLYIIPIVMGLSMFGVSKLGQLGVPPNPQTKIMLYFQQWLIARERLRRAGKLKSKPKPDS
jgi:YidC/Oxa1 family membrane protein insertase